MDHLPYPTLSFTKDHVPEERISDILSEKPLGFCATLLPLLQLMSKIFQFMA